MEVGRSIPRVDAADKVTGRAKYTDDLCPRPVLEAKILHSTIANGWVKSRISPPPRPCRGGEGADLL